MAKKDIVLDAEVTERLIQQRSQATARRFGVATTVAPSQKPQCKQAKQNYANALKDWEANGQPISGPIWETLGAADIDVFVYCEL